MLGAATDLPKLLEEAWQRLRADRDATAHLDVVEAQRTGGYLLLVTGPSTQSRSSGSTWQK